MFGELTHCRQVNLHNVVLLGFARSASSLEHVVLLELALEQRHVPHHAVLQRSNVLAAVELVSPAHTKPYHVHWCSVAIHCCKFVLAALQTTVVSLALGKS